MTVQGDEPGRCARSGFSRSRAGGKKMKYKLDDDRKGFHVWFSDAEFAKLLRDSTVDVSLDAYLEEMIIHNVFDDVAKAVRSGSQSDIPEITFERAR